MCFIDGNESGELVDCPVALGEGDYEVVRTTLLPGILKTLQHNRSMSVKDGVRLFEVFAVNNLVLFYFRLYLLGYFQWIIHVELFWWTVFEAASYA